jgi:hypothetical protein
MLSSFTMAGFSFTVTGLQYFFTDYIFSVIDDETPGSGQDYSNKVVYSSFFTTALLAPILGSILARYLSSSNI